MGIRIRMDTPFRKKKERRKRGRDGEGRKGLALQQTGAFAFMTQMKSARSARMKSVLVTIHRGRAVEGRGGFQTGRD